MDDLAFEAWLDENDFRLPDDINVVNGADRMVDGTFGMVPARKFPTDGRRDVTMDRQLQVAADIRALTEAATCGRPYEALEALAMMRRLYDDLEYEIVALARSYRWSWRDVGDALQVSRSAAQRRFAQYEVPYRVRRQQKGPSNKGPF